MGLRDLTLNYSYDSAMDDILKEFYVPILKESRDYYRIAGYFNSNSLSIAARGIEGLIRNGGKMNLLVSPNFSKEDIKVINEFHMNKEEYIKDTLIYNLDEIIENFEKDNLYALGWMLANNKLELKVAIPQNQNGQILLNDELVKSGLFHQKIGFMIDNEGDVVSFSGSINETFRGWNSNIEEIKVFKSWNEVEKIYCKSDIDKFFKYWNNDIEKVRTIKMPDEVINKFVTYYNDNKDFFEDRSYETSNTYDVELNSDIKLFEYQLEAITKWRDNNDKGLFEMATGTGKTFTAIGCIREIVKEKENSIVIIIATPQNSLSTQWMREVNKFNLKIRKSIIADSTNSNWKHDLSSLLMDLTISREYNISVVYTTHRTLASDSFNEIINDLLGKSDSFLIVDEVHGIGSGKGIKGLNTIYKKRLGLSATPYRWFDESGTTRIFEYFDKIVYKFDLERALIEINPLTNKTYLVPYYYYPIFISLSDDELIEYKKITKNIIKFSKGNKDNTDDKLQNLMFKRANIIKNATLKLEMLDEVLRTIENKEDIIIFCTDKQLNKVSEINNKHNISNHRFTKEQGTKRELRFNNLSEREYIINKFKEKELKALVAIKCLDEGIDIPTANTAILMASSSNPREYIQRIGRVIRQADNKRNARIYDFIVVPDYSKLDIETIALEKRILRKEFSRVSDISKLAINNAEVLNQIFEYL